MSSVWKLHQARERGSRWELGQSAPRAARTRAPGAAVPAGTAFAARRCLRRRGQGLGAEPECAGHRGRARDAAASSSLGLPAACADPAALLPVPDRPLDSPLPDPASPHYPGGDHSQDSSSGGQRCGAWAGVGARSTQEQGKRTKPAPSAGRGAQEAGATRPGAVLRELCPSPRLSVGTGFAPPCHRGLGPASRPRARQRGGGAFEFGGGAEAKLRPVRTR